MSSRLLLFSPVHNLILIILTSLDACFATLGIHHTGLLRFLVVLVNRQTREPIVATGSLVRTRRPASDNGTLFTKTQADSELAL